MSVETSGRQYRFVLWALGLSLPILFFLCVGTVRILVWRVPYEKNFGWTAANSSEVWRVAEVARDGPAAGILEPGDRLVSWNGDDRLSVIGPRFWMHATPPDRRYMLRVERGGSMLAFPLQSRLDPSSRTSTWIPSVLVALAGYFAGLCAVLYKPRERAAQLLYGCSILATGFLIMPALSPAVSQYDSFERWVLFAAMSPYPLLLPATLHFFSRFPPGIHLTKPWIVFRWVTYAFAALLYLPLSVTRLATITINPAWLPIMAEQRAFLEAMAKLSQYGSTLLNMLLPFAMFAVIARNYRESREPGQQHRIQIACFGAVVAVIPSGIVAIWSLAGELTGNPIPEARREVWNNFSTIVTGAIPLTLIYAILKHRVFGVEFVVRRGSQYLLARNVLQVLLLLPIVFIVGRVVRNPDSTVRELLFGGNGAVNLALMGALAAGLRYRKQMSDGLDRRFFREAYNQETILRSLIEEVKAPESTPELSRIVCQKLDLALHPKTLFLYLVDRGSAHLVRCYASCPGVPERIMADTPLYELAGETNQPITGVGNRIQTDSDADWIKRVGAQLFVPLRGSNRIAGLLVLGEKKSEEPYSSIDRNLLDAVAGQVGIVVENLHLKEQIIQNERVQRDVLARLDTGCIRLLKECPACGLCFDSSEKLCSADGAELIFTLPVERLIQGRYRLDRLVGKGGMGAVYAGHDEGLNRRVAVKIMMGALFGDRVAMRRFENEARASARLNHRNIGRIYDYGVLGGEGAYLVMELIEGTTWRKELRRLSAFPPDLAVQRMDALLCGVEAAHRAGIVHRDLKPENVLIGMDESGESVKIVDFGLAKVIRSQTEATASMTAPRTVLGTLGYMAPEQLMGGAVDERTDIFALGVMAVEAVTGNRPFQTASYEQALALMLSESYRIPGESDAVQRLNGVLKRCLAKDKVRRYSSVLALREELLPALAEFPAMPAAPQPDDKGDVTRSISPKAFEKNA